MYPRDIARRSDKCVHMCRAAYMCVLVYMYSSCACMPACVGTPCAFCSSHVRIPALMCVPLATAGNSCMLIDTKVQLPTIARQTDTCTDRRTDSQANSRTRIIGAHVISAHRKIVSPHA